jgi:hypothetical protein
MLLRVAWQHVDINCRPAFCANWFPKEESPRFQPANTKLHACRIGQNRTFMYIPYMTVCLVLSLPKLLHIQRMYMGLANPTYLLMCACVLHCNAQALLPAVLSCEADASKEVILAASHAVACLVLAAPPQKVRACTGSA